MSTILVLSDTHCWHEEQLPEEIRKLVPKVDIVVHCGDYVGPRILNWLSRNARRFIGVRGNMDIPSIWNKLPAHQIIDLECRKIAITHPDWAGPPFHPEELLPFFPNIDLLLFGHLHHPINVKVKNVLCLNPGLGLTSYGLVVIDGSRIEAQIKFIDEYGNIPL